MNEQALRAWLTAWLAAELDLAADSIDEDRPLADLGVGSRMLVQLSGALEELLDRPLSPVVGYRAPTVASLARHLVGAEAAQSVGVRSAAPGGAGDPVAVIGLGCRFPGGADTPAAFWRLLREGRDATGTVPPGRWAAAAQAEGGEDVLARTPSRGGFLTEDPAAFDAEFFGISAREAEAVDPQQRLMLEVAWEALEHAGIPPRSLKGRSAGVFVGASASDYGVLQMNDIERVDAFSGTGSALSIIANRISYTLGLHGPSMIVDTACSSSLVAVHLAMQSLRNGECDLALAGGVNLLLSPAATVNFEDAGVMAADGRSKAFAADADGYGRGEGCGLVVLKRLSQARRDGDTVLAVLRGSAVNQDGASNGLMAPNPAAQHAVIRTALTAADGLEADDIDYVEAHGTGTELGDPLEVEGLAAALAPADRPRSQDLLIGSVKTNIGHLEAAAGVAGLIKVVLSLANGQLPPSLHFDRPNPHIPFDRLPVKVVTANTPWRPRPDRPRRAGVSGFGFGGTNAHLIVEEAPAGEAAPAAGRADSPARPLLFPLSAGSPAALRAHAGRLADWLMDHQDAAPADVLHTLALRRSHEPHRLAVVAADRAALVQGLRAHAAQNPAPTGGGPGPVWVFSGQGSQWEGMGSRLLHEEPAFARSVADLDPLIRAEAGFSVEEVLRSGRLPDGVDAVQPLLFTMQVALAAMWRAHGVRPAAVIGHSMGEVAAAVVAGALDAIDGVRVVCRRSRLLTRVAGAGAMAVVEETEDLLRARLARTRLEGAVDIAVVPGPFTVVVSGDPDAVRRLVVACEADEVNARTVRVDVASHSPQMDPLLAPLREALADLRPRTPAIPFFTTVGGRDGTGPLCDAAYWADNLRAPVRLANAVRRAADAGFTAFVEVSPHPVLTRDVAATLRDALVPGHVLPTLRRGADPREAFLTSLGGLYRLGAHLPWELWARDGRLLDLPRLAWERRRYWTAARPPAARPARVTVGAPPLPGAMTEVPALPGTLLWQTELRAGRCGPLDQHQVDGHALLPMSAYLLTALDVAEHAGLGPVTVRDLTAHAPLALPSGTPVTVQTCLRAATAEGGPATVEVHARAAGEREWTLCASARLHPDAAEDADPLHGDLPAPEPRGTEGGPAGMTAVDPARHRAGLAAAGIEYGEALWALNRLWQGEGSAEAEVRPPAAEGGQQARRQPAAAVLDAGFQALAACFTHGPGPAVAGAAVVTGVDRFRFVAGGAAPGASAVTLRVTAGTRDEPDGSVAADLDWYRGGVRVGWARGVRLRRTGTPARVPAAWVQRIEWQPEPLPAPLPAASSASGGRAGSVLVVADGRGVGAALLAQLRESGVPCRTADAAELAGLSAEAVRDRLGSLADVRHIVHCGALDTEAGAGTDAEAAVRLAADTLHVLQALGGRGGGARLWLVSSLAQAVGDHDPNPAQAQLWGLGRCFALEHPRDWGGLIDLDALAGSAGAEAGAAAVRAELAAGTVGVQCAYRDGVRLVPRLVRAALPTPSRPQPADPDGAHLVVGGTGRIGLLLLRRLVRLGARHLVVVGRGGVPDAVADAVREAGAELTAVRADLTDEDAMRALFARFGTELPALRGIYHLAFTEDVTPVAELDARRLAEVLGPKVAGTALLHLLSADLPVAEFLCYSSTTALLGSHSMAAYAAAGSFQDALVHLRHRAGRAAHVVNWGTWATGLDDAPEARLITATGMRLMDGERAVAALDHVIGAPAAQWVVADADWLTLAAAYATRTPTPLLAEPAASVAAAASAPAQARGRNATEAVRAGLERADRTERRALLRHQVREVVATALDLPDAAALDPEHRFFDLGLDSLRTMTVIRRLKALVPGLRPTALRDNPTVNGFAETLLELMDGGDTTRPAPHTPTDSRHHHPSPAPTAADAT